MPDYLDSHWPPTINALSTRTRRWTLSAAIAAPSSSSLKGELIDLQSWPTRAGARRAIVEYIGWQAPSASSPAAPV